MSNKLVPNKRGLIGVTLLKAYGTNVAGETAGFLPDLARELLRKGIAKLPGTPDPKPKAEEKGAEMTSRQFKPADPLDHDGDGNKGGSAKHPPSAELVQARADYRAAFGKGPFNGWDVDEIRKRIAEKPANG